MSPHCALHTCETAPCPREMWPSAVSTLPLLPMGTTGAHWGLLEGLILVPRVYNSYQCSSFKLRHTSY